LLFCNILWQAQDDKLDVKTASFATPSLLKRSLLKMNNITLISNQKINKKKSKQLGMQIEYWNADTTDLTDLC
jgi:hypothetical protein